ncbi:MAG: transcriptional regulator [Candidatus Thermoplasmatota archaeon]|nr:transcriptional regulator [Candidatus Thermoplasmatota archaeon]
MTALKRVLWYLLGGTRGGPTRARILLALRERPRNTNQLAEDLDLDYKTVQHHLKVLRENRVLMRGGDGYGAIFLPSPEMDESWELFEEITAKVTGGTDDE